MHCCLIQPPLCDPSCPPLGLAYLSAILFEQKVQHEIFDLNLDFINFVENLIPGIDKSSFVENYQLTSQAFRSASELFPDIQMSPFTLDIPSSAGHLSKILTIAKDEKGLFCKWIRGNMVVERVLNSNPDWIGMSVSFFGQLPAALALAAEIQSTSKTEVILGGALLKDFETYIGPRTPIWEHVDGVVIGAGEEILKSLHRAESGRVLPTIGRRDMPNGGWIAKSEEKLTPPLPDFRHFPLEKYRAKSLVLPYRVYARCSWGKCTFCSDAKYTAHLAVAKGNPEFVAEQIQGLAKTNGAKGIYFLDAELPEQFIFSFAAEMKRMKSGLRWGANTRFFKELSGRKQAEKLFAGGCRFLRFGLESASPHVLQLMNKGIDPAEAKKILDATHGAGIATHVYLMRGFPGETEEDWQTTVDFLLNNANVIDMYNVSLFQLYERSPLCQILDPHLFQSQAKQDRWVHPHLTMRDDLSLNFEDLEQKFFSLKSSTRCHPTPADTIILADSEPMKYGNKFCKGAIITE